MDDPTSAVVEQIEKAWGRKAEQYSGIIYALYSEQALTGWFLLSEEPVIQTFLDKKCVCINLYDWIMIKELGATTVTPFRIVAKGKGLIAKAFQPHTGLKYTVRSVDGVAMMFIPVGDFDSV